MTNDSDKEITSGRNDPKANCPGTGSLHCRSRRGQARRGSGDPQSMAELRKDVTPKNIIMIGPTGVGKTEIARRLAQLVGAPFFKVDATKYTEVGYHGRDVESMIRDLTESAVGMVRQEQRAQVETKAKERVADRLLDLLLP